MTSALRCGSGSRRSQKRQTCDLGDRTACTEHAVLHSKIAVHIIALLHYCIIALLHYCIHSFSLWTIVLATALASVL